MSDCPSRFTLVQWKSDDLPAIQQVEVDGHVNGCERCQKIVEELKSNIGEFQLTFDARQERLQRAIRRERAGADGGRDYSEFSVLFKTRIAPAIGILAAAAAIAINIINPWGDQPEADTGDEISFKGDVSVEVVARRGPDQFIVEDATRLQENDSLRFAITTADLGYVEIFSLNALGEPSYFYPDTAPSAQPSPLKIDASGRHELPDAIILDSSTGPKRLVVLFSNNPFDREKVHSKIDNSNPADDDFPQLEPIHVNIIRIDKTPRVK